MQHMIDEVSGDSTESSRAPRRRRRLESTDETRSARRRLTVWCLSMLLGVLVVNSLIGEHGYLATLRAQRDERSLQASLARIRQENAQLQEEAARLREDPAALEEAARRQLGMVKPGETLVILRDARPAPRAR